MRRRGHSLGAVLVLAVAPWWAHAEIHRLSLTDAMQELVAAQGPVEPDSRFSVPLDDFVARIPDMARVVIPTPGSRNIKAIFAVKPPGGEVDRSITVTMKTIDDGSYAVARSSKRALRSWLRKRLRDLMQGHVVLEEIVGLDPSGVSFDLLVDVAADLFQIEEEEQDGRLTDRAVTQIIGLSVKEAGFADFEGGTRQFADFEDRTLLLNIWATWCVPCIAEMPALESLQDRYRHRGLTIVNLSDEPAKVVSEWLAENPSKMLHGRVDGFEFLLGTPPVEGIDRNLGVRPVYVVVDRQGIVRVIRVGSVKAVDGPEAAEDGEDEHHAAAWVKPYL
ncbi:MAG: TlpA disulfide reductase family protein [Gammaproteobacteria bacterium]|nr:TlpA disulfide reductase family protein [Gammaproteobacteria bacterium]